MTKPGEPSRAEAKRQEEAWLAAYRAHEEQLQAMPDRVLDALVATVVFTAPDLTAVPFSTIWDGLGRLVERMRQLGYTMLLNSYEQSHLDWLNTLADSVKQASGLRDGDVFQVAEVTVVDHRGRAWPLSWPNPTGRATTLSRAASIAAVLTRQMAREADALQVSEAEPSVTAGRWTEERRQRQSAQMKAYWQRRRAEETEMEEAGQP